MYRASDGYPLQHRCWRPAGPPRARIIALHGIQSHGAWYQYSSQRLAEAGYEVHFLDRRGSGLNARDRGHAIHEERLIADVRQYLTDLEWRHRQDPELPTVLMGVSWGGKLAAACAATFPEKFAAVALLYPGLFPRMRPSAWQQFRLAWAQAIGWGTIPVPIPLNEPELFTGSPRWQNYIRRDELALHRVSVSFMRANLGLTRYIQSRADRIRGPLLMMLAGKDDIIDNAANRRWLSRLVNARTRLIEYPQARHTLEFEENPDPFIADLREWLQTVLPGENSTPQAAGFPDSPSCYPATTATSATTKTAPHKTAEITAAATRVPAVKMAMVQ